MKQDRILQVGRPEEVVLVVEDEAQVRHLSVEALRELGYTVLQAPSAVTALRVLDPGVHLITKPFTLEQLAAKVRDVLGEAR